MSVYRFVVLLFISLWVGTGFGQNRMLSGKVVDEAGKPIAYASLIVKGCTGGTMAGEDGTFTTSIPERCDTIICTHLNYLKKIEKIEGNSFILFTLTRQMPQETMTSVKGIHKLTTEEINKLKNQKSGNDENDERIFTKVEASALFVGREPGFKQYLEKMVVYPDTATISNVNGVVKVGFTIGKDGLPKNVTLLKGVNKFTDEAVMNAIMKMPKWKPAIQNGRFVEQYKEVSVSFEIVGKE